LSFFVLLKFIAGLLFLITGAELLVRGSSRMAQLLGISPLIVGLTIVAFGTSSPELAVSVFASLKGAPDLAVGNVVGSNIFNILFILGISATIRPLMISIQLIRIDVPLMVFVSLFVYLFGLNGRISQLEAAILFTGLIGYLVFLFAQSKKEEVSDRNIFSDANRYSVRKSMIQWLKNIVYVLIGLILLILGSQFLINSATLFAQKLGVSELIIGLTMVAAGTSLPEVATSVMASIKGEQDIAVGNIVGSNIFNILAVLGLSGLVSPAGILVSPAALRFDMPVMLAVSVACLPVFFTDGKISRWEGMLFFGYYLAYMIYLILQSTHHDAAPFYSSIFLMFILPITFITLMVLSWQAVKRKRTKDKRKKE